MLSKQLNMRVKSNEQNSLWLLLIIAIISLNIFTTQRVFASDSIEKAGDILQVLIPAVALGSTFYLEDLEGRSQFYKSAVTTFVATHGLKNTIDKKRPNGSSQSFPSGHTSAAFQGASFIHKRYGVKYAIPAYIGASFVGYSRVESDNHYVEDVLAGAVIGIASSFYFVKPYKGFDITAFSNGRIFGISLLKDF